MLEGLTVETGQVTLRRLGAFRTREGGERVYGLFGYQYGATATAAPWTKSLQLGCQWLARHSLTVIRLLVLWLDEFAQQFIWGIAIM